MSIVIDRRNEPGKGRGSHERLLQRTRGAARDAINKAINNGSITDVGKDGVDVTVPKGGLSEPHITHGEGGVNSRTLPGNNNKKARFRAGDHIQRPEGGGDGDGTGEGEASEDGEGEDSFQYHISEKEFLDILFEDLELPNMYKLGAFDTQKVTLENAGYSHSGTYNRLSLIRSKLEKSKREIFMNKGSNEKILALLGEEKEILNHYGSVPAVAPKSATPSAKVRVKILDAEVKKLKEIFLGLVSPVEKARIYDLQTQIGVLESRKRVVSKWREKEDLRYRAVEEQPVPTSKAVMFCEMDVSGSMSEEMKSNAKLFYLLLYRFLQRQYDHVDVVFIRHHSVADEVDEKEFFEGRASGGTVVSTVHEKLLEIQKARYPEKEWNIYAAQASDGDNSSSDSDKTSELMRQILPIVQGFFHIEVGSGASGNYYYSRSRETDLWQTYAPLAEEFKDRFWMAKVKERKDVWPIFRELFKKRNETPSGMKSSVSAFTPG